MEEELTQEGRNGGTLKRGNTVGVGRKPSQVRDAYRGISAESAKWIAKVAAGKPVIEIPGKKTKRCPTFDERMKAIEMANKYGLGTKQEITGEDEAPIMIIVK